MSDTKALVARLRSIEPACALHSAMRELKEQAANTIDTQAAELERLRARVAELEAAGQPLAAIATQYLHPDMSAEFRISVPRSLLAALAKALNQSAPTGTPEGVPAELSKDELRLLWLMCQERISVLNLLINNSDEDKDIARIHTIVRDKTQSIMDKLAPLCFGGEEEGE